LQIEICQNTSESGISHKTWTIQNIRDICPGTDERELIMRRISEKKLIAGIIILAVIFTVILFAFALPKNPVYNPKVSDTLHGGDGKDIQTTSGETADLNTLRILATPDIHSHIFPMSDNDTGTRIGRIAALADTLGEEDDNTLYLFAGDLGEGSFYHMYSGIPEVKSYSMAGVDAAVPGNHAFDFSTGIFKQWVTDASYPVVCANLDFTDPELNQSVKDYTILDAGGMKVGVFGIITPQLEKIVNLGDDVILYKNTTETGNLAVKSLKNEGADIIIALTHQEKDEDLSFANSVPGIDLIIGGHDHLVWNETVTSPDGRNTLIVHSGKYGEELDTVDVTSGKNGIIDSSVGRYQITEDMPGDDAITSYAMSFYDNYTESLSKPIGYTTVPLDLRQSTLRTGETNAGDLVADSIRKNVPGVDIAMINSGSIRGDCIIPAGEITYLTVSKILPYENIIVKIEMTGQEIKDTLERSASAIIVDGDNCPGDDRLPSGGFLQVSGINFEINTEAETFCLDSDADSSPVNQAGSDSETKSSTIKCAGMRIENLSVVTESGFVPVDSSKTYTVAVNDYISAGGDGHTNLEAIPESRKYNTGINLENLLTDDIVKNSPITPDTDGRIKVLR
jgi:2',3'-cyclic-nucleotide 2'-phosphodiesterase (5'-nucleotidase family)